MAEENIQQVRHILAAQIELAKLHIENWLVFFAFLRRNEKSKSSAAEPVFSTAREILRAALNPQFKGPYLPASHIRDRRIIPSHWVLCGTFKLFEQPSMAPSICSKRRHRRTGDNIKSWKSHVSKKHVALGPGWVEIRLELRSLMLRLQGNSRGGVCQLVEKASRRHISEFSSE